MMGGDCFGWVLADEAMFWARGVGNEDVLGMDFLADSTRDSPAGYDYQDFGRFMEGRLS